GQIREQLRVLIGQGGERRHGVVEVAAVGDARRIGNRVRVHRLPLRVLNQRRPRGGQIAQQLDRTALLRRRPVVERRGVDLRRQVQEEPDLLLQQTNQ